MSCPEPNLLADVVHGQAQTHDAAALQVHLGECLRCADVVAAVIATSWASEGTNLEGRVPKRPSEIDTQPIGGGDSTRPIVYGGTAIIPPGTRLGRYRVRRWLGRGGMGEVYEGYDPELDRRVALKLLRARSNDDATAQRRLRREAQTLARLSSPHVVAALDVGVFGGALFLVMELVEGPTLAAWLAQKPRAWREILDMFLAAGEGLAAAHEVGVIHRDFKPQNVLIGTDGKPRVSDFGLAREAQDQPAADDSLSDPGHAPGHVARDALPRTAQTVAERFDRVRDHTAPPEPERTALTRTGLAIGTPRYMAPEQFLRRPLDARVDQFSFCVALYEALYGRHPFAPQPVQRSSDERVPAPAVVDDLESLRSALLSGRPTRPPAQARVPRAIAVVLRRGLALQPEGRYPTFGGLLTALRRARSARWPRALVGATTLVLVGLSLAFVFLRGEPGILVPTGEPADWSTARVLTRGPDPIHCIQRIDDKTLRLVWGTPHQVADIDVETGSRRPTNLAPVSYRHGCPSVSPDHRHILFEGYDANGRPHVFYAKNTTGEGAQPLVPTMDPTLNSEPRWLSSSEAFVFDVDAYHPGIWNIRTGRLQVLPDRNRLGVDAIGFFKTVGPGDQIVVTENLPSGEARIQTYKWPDLHHGDIFRVQATGYAWASNQGSDALVGPGIGPLSDGIGVLNTRPRRLSFVARFPGRDVLSVEPLATALAIVTRRMTSRVSARKHSEREVILADDDSGAYQNPSVTARGDVLVTHARGKFYSIVLLDGSDGRSRPISFGPSDFRAAAFPNGEWVLARYDRTHPEQQGIFTCADLYGATPSSCKKIASDFAFSLAASPDDRTVAFATTEAQGMVIRLIDVTSSKRSLLAANATECQPVWVDARTVWVSIRNGSRYEWTEFDVPSNTATGRTRPGSTPCFDDLGDPMAPSFGPVRIDTRQEWDVRLAALP